MEELYEAAEKIFTLHPPLGHDFKHGTRTASLARKIAKGENYDQDEAEIAGLLHDIGRTVKGSIIPHGHEGAPIARDLLDTYTSFSKEAKERIAKAIYVHSELTTEGKLNNILQDADKLDGLGAVGLTRAMMTNYSKPDFDPNNIFPENAIYGKTQTASEQIRVQLNWYGMLYTETARKIGKPRHDYMLAFMEELKREVEESK